MRKIDIKYLKEIKCVNGRVLYIKEKDIFKKLLLKFLTALVSSSSKEMVIIKFKAVSSHFYSH